MAPSELKFELTETSKIKDTELATSLLQQLKRSGNSIALDDFGTGYSGLGHLQLYPFKTIKLDQSFVREIRQSATSYQLVLGSISMAKSLQLDLVAEGIETEDVAITLAELGCDYAQGYLFGKPKPLAEWLLQ